MKLLLTLHNIEDSMLNRCINTNWLFRWIFMFVGMPLFIMSIVIVSVLLFSLTLTILGI